MLSNIFRLLANFTIGLISGSNLMLLIILHIVNHWKILDGFVLLSFQINRLVARGISSSGCWDETKQYAFLGVGLSTTFPEASWAPKEGRSKGDFVQGPWWSCA